jgi:hypothetical protein
MRREQGRVKFSMVSCQAGERTGNPRELIFDVRGAWDE